MNFFNDPPNVAVLTTKQILEQKSDILLVFHDEDDGMWQFLDRESVDENDVKMISLEEMVKCDNSILQISDLPLGWVAWREHKEDIWTQQAIGN